ncbi:MAG: hypothetical protein ACJ0O7_00105 [Flavobacteriaceae bacterium]
MTISTTEKALLFLVCLDSNSSSTVKSCPLFMVNVAQDGTAIIAPSSS